MFFKLLYPNFWRSKNIIAYLLYPFSLIYFVLTCVRNILVTPLSFEAKIISIGNISVGGTGKTQVAAYLAKMFQARSVNFVIITKAYNSKLKKPTIVNKKHNISDVGDESIMLSAYGPVIASRNVKDAYKLIKSLKPQIIIIDDGMQNPNLTKDLAILTIDASRGFGNELLIPAGPCRQSIKSGFAAADLSIVISAVDSSMLDLDGELYRSKPGFIAKMINIDKWDIAKNYFAFTGIGNPERFFATLQNHKLHIVDHMIFPDHHNYSQKDLDYLLAQSSKQKAILITTRKDYVKIDNKLPILCFDVELLIEKEEELIKLIDAKIF